MFFFSCFVYMDWYLWLILLILVSVHIEGDYIKNQCRSDNTSCIPCSQRLPSCVGHSDGNNPVIGHYWSADYLICLRNRTISVNKCQSGLFDPVNRRCTLIVDISKLYLCGNYFSSYQGFHIRSRPELNTFNMG